MDLSLYLAFVLATVLLALFPGPNMALIVSTSIAHGARAGFQTLLGTSAALAVQLALVSVGMSTALATLGQWFDALRWAGAIYLVYLGVQSWRSPPPTLVASAGARRSAGSMALRGMVVSLTNPKTLLFFGAFFPQFVSPDRDLGVQLAVLSATFLAVVLALDSLWAVLASRARRWIVARGRWINRISGGMLVGAGVGLALARR